MKTKNIIYIKIVLIALLFQSCKPKESLYAERLKSESAELLSIKQFIDKNLLRRDLRSRFSLIFTSDTTNLHIKYYIYNGYLAEKMKQLHIREIRYDKTTCSLNKHFDNMYFQLESDDTKPQEAIYFVFDECNKNYNVITKNIYQKTVLKNWSILVDRG